MKLLARRIVAWPGLVEVSANQESAPASIVSFLGQPPAD